MQSTIAQFCLKQEIASRERANSIDKTCERSKKFPEADVLQNRPVLKTQTSH